MKREGESFAFGPRGQKGFSKRGHHHNQRQRRRLQSSWVCITAPEMLRPSGALATDFRSKEETRKQPKEAPVWCTTTLGSFANQERQSQQGKALTWGSVLLCCLMEVCPRCFLRQTDSVSIHDMEHSLNHTHFLHPWPPSSRAACTASTQMAFVSDHLSVKETPGWTRAEQKGAAFCTAG